jgi:hypothetical protein
MVIVEVIECTKSTGHKQGGIFLMTPGERSDDNKQFPSSFYGKTSFCFDIGKDREWRKLMNECMLKAIKGESNHK